MELNLEHQLHNYGESKLVISVFRIKLKKE